jgi:hypothetical protein
MKTDCCKCQISFSMRSCPWCIQEEVGSAKAEAERLRGDLAATEVKLHVDGNKTTHID